MRTSRVQFSISVLIAALFAGNLSAAEPEPAVSPAPNQFEIPAFSPPEKIDSPPADAAALPLIARIREQAGSPLESAAWKPVPGASPLKVPSHPVGQPNKIERVAATSNQTAENDPFGESGPSWPLLARQFRNLAVEMEKSAAICEEDALYERADELRKMSSNLWKQARVLQGWSETR